MERSSGTQVLPPGTKVSHYEIVEVLGRGGMGIVYRAADTQLGREVALKCVRPDRSDDETLQRRMHREARAASGLSHPCIVTVYDVLSLDGNPAIVMELIHGQSLREKLTGGPLEIEQLIRYAEGLADALSYAHGKRILHRDINPNNIVIGPEDRALLMDFGLAGRFATPEEGTVASTMTVTSGMLVGTPGYMSPDQLLGKKLDQRSDIFSFGCVLYEMCTGERAFPSDKAEVIDATLNREPLAISRLNYEVPEELERIVRKAMAKRPDERYQRAGEITTDLRALRRRTESSIAVPLPELPRRSRAPWFAVAAFGAMALATVLAWPSISGLFRGDRALPSVVPRQLTTSPALEYDPQISPAGDFVVFVSEEAGNPDLYITDVETGGGLRLTDDPAADTEPTWYPDGSKIAFVSTRAGRPAIWSQSRLGSSPLMVLDDAVGPAVSPDGKRLAFVRRDEESIHRIWVGPLDDLARAVQLTDGSGSRWDHTRPVWSPDGTTLCYQDNYDDLWLVPSAGGPARKLTTEGPYNLHPGWAPDGRHVYYSSLAEGTKALWRVGVSSGRVERVTHGTGFEVQPSFSRDGRRMAYATRGEASRILLLDLESGLRSALPSLPAVYSPVAVGERVLMLSERTSSSELWEIGLESDGSFSKPRQITQDQAIGTFAISSDERFVAYHRSKNGQRDIWILAAEGGVPINLTSHAAADFHPAWSPDGSTLAFVSERAGQADLWMQPMRDGAAVGEPRRITEDAANEQYPRWSSDGSTLAFVAYSAPGNEVWTVPASGGVPTQVTRGAGALAVDWAAGTLLVSGTWGGSDIEVRRVDRQTGKETRFDPPLVQGPAGEAFGDFSVSPDGTSIAYLEQRPSVADIWMLEASNGSF